MINNTIHFEVAIKGLCLWFNNFNEARDEYYALKECGFHEAVLRKVVAGEKTLCWNDRVCMFIR